MQYFQFFQITISSYVIFLFLKEIIGVFFFEECTHNGPTFRLLLHSSYIF